MKNVSPTPTVTLTTVTRSRLIEFGPMVTQGVREVGKSKRIQLGIVYIYIHVRVYTVTNKLCELFLSVFFQKLQTMFGSGVE